MLVPILDAGFRYSIKAVSLSSVGIFKCLGILIDRKILLIDPVIQVRVGIVHYTHGVAARLEGRTMS